MEHRGSEAGRGWGYLASGAQWVSTDYPDPSPSHRFGTGYAVQIPGGTRCTPIAPANAPASCTTIP